MKNILKWIGIGLTVLILSFLLLGSMLPTTYSISRSVTIQGDAARVHEYVGDLTKWDLWAPWKDEDPTIVTTFGVKTSGVGASQSWVGKEGDGSLTFTSSSPAKGIEYDLFFDNGAYQCWAAMYYKPEGANTTVEWQMKGDMETPVLGGYVAIMMDSLVGDMFDRGLTKLKNVVEQGSS